MAFCLESVGHVVTKYRELKQLVDRFASGHLDLLVVVGDGGLGKTQITEKAMRSACRDTEWRLLTGKHTPLALYEALYQNRRLPLVLDDLDALLANRDNVALLKCVCDTRPVKQVQWGSRHAAFNKGIPGRFESVSRVCILANDLGCVTRDLEALLDRGMVVS